MPLSSPSNQSSGLTTTSPMRTGIFVKAAPALMPGTQVMEKVGHLVLLEGTDFGTMKQVADFYEVPVETIKTIVYHCSDAWHHCR